MKTNRIIFDADGVLLDTLPYAIKWFFLNVPNFDMSKLFKFKADYLFDKFADDFEIFANIPPMKGAVDIVKKLSKDYKIDVISSYGGNVRRFFARAENIDKYFGNSVNEIFNIPQNESKEILYNKYEKGTVVIDDDLGNCNKALKLGLKPFWYKYYSPFSILINNYPKKKKNNSRKNIISVSKFIEIEQKLLER